MNEKLYRSSKDINGNLNLNMSRAFSGPLIAVTGMIVFGWIVTCWIKSGARVSYNNKNEER